MKQKFILFIETLLLSVCFPFSAFAYDVEVDGIYYNIVTKDKTAEVTYGDNQYKGEVVIPETFTVDDVVYNVTSIGFSAFEGCKELSSTTIPNSVTSIGAYACKDCTGLASISIPNSVTIIDGFAFQHCTGLTSIKIPNSVTSIGFYAFQECTRLTSITIPDSLTIIEDNAFELCIYEA